MNLKPKKRKKVKLYAPSFVSTTVAFSVVRNRNTLKVRVQLHYGVVRIRVDGPAVRG